MSDVAALIERAANRMGGNKSALARALNVPPTLIHEWASGRRTCTVDDRVLLAAAAGEEWQQEAARALIEKHADGPRGELFRKVLGKLSRRTDAVSGFAWLALASLIWTCGSDVLHTMYIGSSVDAIYDLLIRVSP